MGYGQDAVARAVHEALKPIATLETTWPQNKLESRTCSYFRNASKTMDFDNKPCQELLLEFTGNAFASMFQAIPDRPWLNQVDFVPVLAAGVKEVFPPNLLAEVPPSEFEPTLICAHDQSYEEMRYSVILYDVLTVQIKEKKAKNRIYIAFEQGRKDAVQVDFSGSSNPQEDFANHWISNSIQRLRVECAGWPENALPKQNAVWLFNSLIDEGTFPVSLVAFTGPIPSNWPVVGQAVHMAYTGPGWKGAGKKGAKNAIPDPPRALAWSLYGRGSPNGGPSGARQSGGHPMCTQGSDCLGTPDTPLVCHIEETGQGDVYCTSCWAVFEKADPTLRAIPFPTCTRSV
jgi:hypothetical protein